MFTGLSWAIRPQLVEWAEVIAYDARELVDEPAGTLGHEDAAERGLAAWDDRGWDSCFIAGDGFGVAVALQIAVRRPDRVEGLALGHAALSQRRDGDRPPINDAVWSTMMEMLRTDSEAFIRNAFVQLTRGSFDEDLMRRMMTLYSPERLEEEWLTLTRPDLEFSETLKELDLPMLLGKHEGCLLHTDEGYEDAVAAFPDARTVSTEDACSTDPRFGEAMQEFCEEVLRSA